MSFTPFTFEANSDHFGKFSHTMDEEQTSDAIEKILGKLQDYVNKDKDPMIFDFIEYCMRNYSLNLMSDSKKGTIYQHCSQDKLGAKDCSRDGHVGDYYIETSKGNIHYEHKWTGEAKKSGKNTSGNWVFSGFDLSDTYDYVHLRVEDQHRFFELPYDDEFKQYLSDTDSGKKRLSVGLGGRTPLYKYIMEHERNDLAKLIWPEIPEVQNRPDSSDDEDDDEDD